MTGDESGASLLSKLIRKYDDSVFKYSNVSSFLNVRQKEIETIEIAIRERGINEKIRVCGAIFQIYISSEALLFRYIPVGVSMVSGAGGI